MGQECSKITGSILAEDSPGTTPRTSHSKGKPGSKNKKSTSDEMDRYEIVKQLGEGGFGVVHLVREKATSEEWAAKYLKVTDDSGAAGQGDRMTREDIRNECEILKMMNHSSICKLREDFEIEGGSQVVMVLELLSGGDLLDSVIDNGTYSEADAREIFIQVLDGVKHIHEQGEE